MRPGAPLLSMSTPNPLTPQGSLLEKQGRGRSTFQIISFIGAIHVVALCGLLWIGCKKDDQAGGTPADPQANSGLPPVGGDMGLPPVGAPPAADPFATGNPGGAGLGGSPALPGTPAGWPGLPPVAAGNPLNPGGLPPLPPVGGNVGLPPVDTGAASVMTTSAGEYKVQKGDFGTTIAKKAGVSLTALKAANPSVNWSKLKVNQVLAIPAATAAPAVGVAPTPGMSGPATAAPAADGTSYQVRPGDTGSKIAKKTGVSWKSIRAANGLTSDNIRPGQKLTIPAKGSTAATPAGAGAVPPPSAVPTATALPSLPGR